MEEILIAKVAFSRGSDGMFLIRFTFRNERQAVQIIAGEKKHF